MRQAGAVTLLGRHRYAFPSASASLHVVCSGFFLGHARRLGHDDGAAMPHVLRLLLRSAACSKHGATDERLGTVWARQLHPSRATEPRDGATWWLRAAAKPHPNY